MKPLTLNDIERLGELLAAVPDPFVPMEADQLDGFLTALCLLKVPPAIDDWFVYVLDASGNPNKPSCAAWYWRAVPTSNLASCTKNP